MIALKLILFIFQVYINLLDSVLGFVSTKQTSHQQHQSPESADPFPEGPDFQEIEQLSDPGSHTNDLEPSSFGKDTIDGENSERKISPLLRNSKATPQVLPNHDGEVKSSPGMEDSIETLYGIGDDVYTRWVEEYPRKVKREVQDHFEEQRHAFVVKMKKRPGDGNVGMQLHSITVQSPLVKPLIAKILEGYPGRRTATSTDDMVDDYDETFYEPFRPFYFCIEKLEQVVQQQTQGGDEETVALKTGKHLTMFYDAIMVDIRETVDRSRDLLIKGYITYQYYWTLFPPNTLIAVTTSSEERIYKVEKISNSSGTKLHCKYVGWDGDKLGYVNTKIYLPSFEGKKKISDLSVTPLSKRTDEVELSRRLMGRGKKFEVHCGHYFRSFQGLMKAQAQWDGFRPFVTEEWKDVS
jgi:hypothetical protein